MTPRLRKVMLTAHITASIGWFGAVAAFFALAIVGLSSQDAQRIRGADLGMELSTWFVIVPFALVSLLSGVISALGTPWGLFRYYWIVVKLLITIFATVVLLVHTRPIDALASVMAKTDVFRADLHGRQLQMVVASGAALLVLLLLTALSVYKPRGITPYGSRRSRVASEARW